MAKQKNSSNTEVTAEYLHTFASGAFYVVVCAIETGWATYREAGGSIRLTSPVGAQELRIPSKQRSFRESVIRTWTRKVFRYGDPIKVALLRDLLDDLYGAATDEKRTEILSKFPARGPGIELLLGQRDVLPTLVRHIGSPEPEPEPEPVVMSEPEAEDRSIIDQAEEPTLLTTTPWIAKRAMTAEGGRVYESHAVLERKWSDGAADYLCAFPDCGYAHPEPRSVARHYGGAHGKERPASAAQQDEYLDPGKRWVPTERQAGRIARLAKELKQAKEVLADSPTEFDIAAWIIQQRDLASSPPEERVLTSEQVIERIRRLVDGGAYADLMARIAVLEEEVANATRTAEETNIEARVAVIEEEITTRAQELVEVARAHQHEAEARAERAEGDLEALRDLLNKPRTGQ